MNLEEKFLNQAASEKLPEGIVEVLPLTRDPEQFSATATKREGGVGFVESTAPSAISSGGKTEPITPLTEPSIISQKAPSTAPISTTGTIPIEGRVFPENTSSIQNIPRNTLQEMMGNIGSAIQSGADYLDFAVIGLPDVGTLSLKDLTVGDLGKVMEAMSHGFYPVETKSAAGLPLLMPTAEALDLLNAIPAFQAAGKAVKYGAKELAPAAANLIEQGLRKTGMIMDIVPSTTKGRLSDITNTITELSNSGIEPKSIMDAEKAISNGDRVFAFHEMSDMPIPIKNVGDLKAYTPDQLLVLPAKQQAQTTTKVANTAIDKVGKVKKGKAAEINMAIFDEPIPVQPSIKTLSGSFDNALSSYLALPHEQQVIKTREANAALAKWLGLDKDGKTKSLFGKNQKLKKTETGVDGEEAITLPDGRGVENSGLSLSPAYKEGKFTTCPNSASCSQECLGKTAGGYFQYGGGKDLEKIVGPRFETFRRTQAFMRDPENFAIKLHNEISAMKFIAAQNGNHLAIRLNMLSDINPRVHEQLIKAHPDVTFYDYTKNNTNPIAHNHHYTYSSTGVSQNVNGKEVVNPNQNWKQMRRRLDEGKNVSMVFSTKKVLPQTVFDEETGKTYKVINGDSHDFRPLDAVPAGTDGVIIGLKNKAITRKQENAAVESEGFFVHYDPQIIKAKGKFAKDESGNLMVQNTEVKISKQSAGQITMTNDYTPVKEQK